MEVLPHNPAFQINEPQMEDTVNKIIEYGANMDNIRELSQQHGGGMDTDGLPLMGAESQLKSDALTILENLAMQILHVFATSNVTELFLIVAHPEDEAGAVRIRAPKAGRNS